MTWRDVVCVAAGLLIGVLLGNIDRLNPRRWRRLDWRSAAIIISAGVMLAMGVWTNALSTEAKRQSDDNAVQTAQIQALARQVATCSKEFQTVLVEQSKLSRLSDQFALDVSTAAAIYQQTIANPPPEIAVLDINDPVRQRWFRGAADNYYRTIDPLNIRRQQTLDQRNKRPYPAPLCGK